MKTKLSHFAIPYVVWMAIFVVAPIIIMVVYAFSNGAGGATLDNFVQMGGYAAVFGRSFKLSCTHSIKSSSFSITEEAQPFFLPVGQ